MVPEFIGPDCRADLIAPALDALLAGPRRADGRRWRLTMERLGQGGEPPGLRAARSVLSALSGAVSGVAAGAASPLMIARTCGISGPILSVDQHAQAPGCWAAVSCGSFAMTDRPSGVA